MGMGFLHRFSRHSHVQLYHVRTIYIKCHQNQSGKYRNYWQKFIYTLVKFDL